MVTFPPGGGTDVLARILGAQLGDAWNEQVVIDNRPGASGNIGAELVARAAPDGYTLLMVNSTFAMNASLYSKLPYDSLRDFSAVARVASTSGIVAAHPSINVRSVPELLAAALPARVGSPLSLNALREDLQVSHQTVARWLEVLERLYAIFRVSPFGAPRLRAVKKEQKHYHFDWTVVGDQAARFENLVASHVLKWAHYQVDTQGRDVELRYYRDIDGREVDFVLVDAGRPVGFVECKWDDAEVAPALRYLHQRFPDVPAWQVSAVGRKDFETPDGIRVAPARVLLSQLV